MNIKEKIKVENSAFCFPSDTILGWAFNLDVHSLHLHCSHSETSAELPAEDLETSGALCQRQRQTGELPAYLSAGA